MKYLLCVVLLLNACIIHKIKKYDGPVAMDRASVVSGARDCINGRMKPDVQYVSQKTPQGVVLVPVEVLCVPYASR